MTYERDWRRRERPEGVRTRSGVVGRIVGRPLLFYSAWPLGYHNREAELKARGFARGGYDVVYVTGVGTRNPRISRLPKVADRVGRKLRAGRGAPAGSKDAPELRNAAVLVAPPRQLPAVRRFNAMWLERQLRHALPTWHEAVAWVRTPSPELVEALGRLRPAATIYECVDAYHLTPGITGRWAAIAERAERELVLRADAVVVPGETLAERFRAWGADVRIVPHGVELFPWRERERGADQPIVVGFVGTLDHRLDVSVLRRVCETHPDWRLRLIGATQEGFEPSRLSDLRNVSIEPAVPYDRLGETLASFDVGIMPYVDSRFYRYMTPVKNLELLAAGRPAVARPNPALMPYADLLYFAQTSDEFVGQLERAVQEDSMQLARARRRVAEANSWDERIGRLHELLTEVLP